MFSIKKKSGDFGSNNPIYAHIKYNAFPAKDKYVKTRYICL